MSEREAVDSSDVINKEEHFEKLDEEYSKAMAEWFEETIYDACLGG